MKAEINAFSVAIDLEELAKKGLVIELTAAELILRREAIADWGSDDEDEIIPFDQTGKHLRERMGLSDLEVEQIFMNLQRDVHRSRFLQILREAMQ